MRPMQIDEVRVRARPVEGYRRLIAGPRRAVGYLGDRVLEPLRDVDSRAVSVTGSPA